MKRILLVLIFAAFSQFCHAQFNLVVNEFSQGTGGTKEFIELLVVGTRTCTDSTADIRNWTFDDQNGWYGASGTGIALGHYRFLNDPNWQRVPYGSIILIFNNGDQNGSIPAGASDPTDADNDYVYIVPINNNLIEQNTSTPSSPSSAAFTYPLTGYSASGSWSSLGLSNSGDGVVISNPANLGIAHFSILFGLTAGAGFQTPTVTVGEVAGNKNCFLSDDQFSTASSWVIGNAGTSDETPGSGNTTANIAWIQSLRVQANAVTPTYTPIQPTCIVPTGTLTITAPIGSSYTYSIDGINFQSSPVFTGVFPGSYTVTVLEGGLCPATVPVVIAAVPAAPVTPLSSVVDPTCTTATGTVTITSPLGAGLTYSIDGTTFQSSPVFTGLAPNTYTVTVQAGPGCTSTGTAIVSAAPGSPATPVATVVNPTCTNPTGTITISTPIGAGLTYSIDGTTFQSSPVFTGVVPNTYTITAQAGAGCISTSTVTVLPVPGAPAAPVSTVLDPTCTLPAGTITITTPVGSGLTYSIDGNTFQSSPVFPGLVPNTYTITVKDAAGCTSTGTANVNAVPGSPANPSSAVINPTCTTPTGTITISNPTGAGLTYSIDGINYQSSPVFPGLTPNIYTITVKNASGCTSTGSATVPPAPGAPLAPGVVTPVNYCQGATAIPLTATGTSLLWYAASIGGTGSATAPLPSTATPGTTTYYVSQTVSGCESPRIAIDVIVSFVSTTPISGNTNICVSGNSSTQLSNSTTGGTWSSGDPSIAVVDGNGLVTGISQGSVSIFYTLNSGGCSASVSTTINVGDFVLNLTGTPNPATQGNAVTLNTSGATGYQVIAWLPTATFTDQTALSQTITAANPLTYAAVGQGLNGCTDTARFSLTVISPDEDVFVPNVFTPNNDGKNDQLRVYGNSIVSIDLRIYNQWGEAIFQTNDKNTGWDGRSKGKMQPITVYIYTLKAIMQNGSVITKKGSVTLIR